jgi:hypothetical protein
MELQILKAFCELERVEPRIFPWMVQARIDYPLCEQTVRRKLVELWQRGKLIRLGERKGYILNRV